MRVPGAVAGAILLGLVVTAAGSGLAHADDSGHTWTSLYDGTAYAGSGWSNCPDPIRVSVDVRGLAKDQRTKAKNALKIALQKWNAAKAVHFAYAGQVPVHFDADSGVTTPEDGVARDRWIYLTAVKGGNSDKVDPNVVGLAAPLRVDPDTHVIVEGSAAFRASYVNASSKALVAELFAHELGHVFGLGHSTSEKDLMYPILEGHKKLGAGDKAGAWALLKPCPTPPAPAG